MSPSREKTATAMIPEHTTNEFSLSNPIADPDYYSVSKLLRRLADHPEEFGDNTIVRDLLLECEEYKDPDTHEYYEKLWPSITVYCSRRETTLTPKTSYFPMTNPDAEPGHRSVPKLLRRVADRLDGLGDDAAVLDLIMHAGPAGGDCAPSANTYYTREEGWVRNFDPQTHELLEWARRHPYSDTDEPGEEQRQR
jgi:hypothetical protein